MLRRAAAAALLAALLLGACTSENDQFIQGRWIFEDLHFDGLVGETYLTTIWVFDRGTFSFDACCFNVDTSQWGRYRIIEDEGDILTLELFNVQGDVSLRMAGEVRVRIDRAANTLNIMGAGPYVRP